MSWVFALMLGPPAVLVALPAFADAWAWFAGRRRRPRPAPEGALPHLLFLVPAHNESLLIERCAASLLGQDYDRALLTVVVVADNCTDDTAALARSAGALVLERATATHGGKGHAIGWALDQLRRRPFDAVVIVDADTILEPDYASQLAAFRPLRNKALQSYDGMSNEFETWLTTLAGVLTRMRYGIVLPLKRRAGLTCPLTGDGTVLGRDVIDEWGWNIRTITEGWELWARYTLAGLDCHYVPLARLYAQEARSLAQSGTQRGRWTAGRLAVLRLYAARIITTRGIPWLQKIDLLAELSSLGPMMRAALGVAGTAAALGVGGASAPWLAAAFLTGLVQPAWYALLAMRSHPQKGRVARAALRLPVYAAWRVVVGVGASLSSGRGRWTRTRRHEEPAGGADRAPPAGS